MATTAAPMCDARGFDPSARAARAPVTPRGRRWGWRWLWAGAALLLTTAPAAKARPHSGAGARGKAAESPPVMGTGNVHPTA